ncbi:ADP-ribosyltransferase [Apilactobacillus apisilvae]|uniref:ADP-ribosyltransferase n=1 Tax=Apilactobacillus apisilvae TaxID=2923364 RepID=A0ABY4PFR7_9LACO|nr:ADP-ribosyltransferase [Apilactobacillus apisilvae]UQS84648.1 ADP-ribosyltransferase [Apilactobacillus apisilvae]
MKRASLITLLSTLAIGFTITSGQVANAKQKNNTNYVSTVTNKESNFNTSDAPVTQRVANQDLTVNEQNSSNQVTIKKGTVMTIKDGNNRLVTIPGNSATLEVNNINSVSYPNKSYYYSKKDYDNLYAEGAKWSKGLSKTQYKAVGDYSLSGYNNDNTYLRTGKSKKITKTKAEVKNIQAALKKFNLKKPMTVYRGLNGVGYSKGLNGQKNQVGSVYSDAAFQSTSVDQSAAVKFLNSSEKNANNNILIKLNVPAGYHGAYINSISKSKNEKEYLLNSGKKMVITRIQTVNANVKYNSYQQKNSDKVKNSSKTNEKFNYKLVTMNLVD